MPHGTEKGPDLLTTHRFSSGMLSKPGTYILILRNRSRKRFQVGRWGTLEIRPGYYLYVGSALGPGGLQARVARHCREGKSKHWHIDYLREHAALLSVWYRHAAVAAEHRWAAALAGMPGALPLKGFGCSDCKCQAHLFYMQAEPAKDTFSKLIGRPVEEWSECNSGSVPR